MYSQRNFYANHSRTSPNLLKSSPAALSEMLLALDFYLDKPENVIFVTAEGRKSDAEIFMAEFRK